MQSLSVWFAIALIIAICAMPGTLAEKLMALGYYAQTLVHHVLGN